MNRGGNLSVGAVPKLRAITSQNNHFSSKWPTIKIIKAHSFIELLKFGRRKCLYFFDCWSFGRDMAIFDVHFGSLSILGVLLNVDIFDMDMEIWLFNRKLMSTPKKNIKKFLKTQS